MSLNKFIKWTNSFWGALILAILSAVAMFNDIALQRGVLALAMGACTIYWLWIARRAIRTPTPDDTVELTDDQKKRILEATSNLGAVIKQVELEVTQAQRDKAKENTDG